MDSRSWFEKLNDCVNLLAIGLMCFAVVFSHQGAKDLAGQLIAGAIGLMGGKSLAQAAARRSTDNNGGNNGQTTQNGNGNGGTNGGTTPSPSVSQAGGAGSSSSSSAGVGGHL